jgi:uncharacterized RDD family membrane protein YckC
MSASATAEEVFAGFWVRVGAAVIDCILLAIIVFPLLHAVYGAAYWESTKLIAGPMDFLLSWVLPAIATIIFWVYKQSTPGKMALGIRIADAASGNAPSTSQCVGRYFAYIVSIIPLFLGFFWIAWDARKQAFHDKLAGTVVLRRKRAEATPRFQAS